MKKKIIVVFIVLGAVLTTFIGGFVVWRIVSILTTNSQIRDTNGTSTEVETLDPETFDCESFEYYSMLTSNSNYGSNTDAPFKYKDCDFDNVNYSFGKISGVKLLQCTNCIASNGVVDLQIQSEIKEGNFEIAIYKNDIFIKNVNINSTETESISYVKNDIIKIVAFGESAKVSVSVSRNIK